MVLACLLLSAACSGLPGGGTASAPRTAAPTPLHQAQSGGGASAWILPALGLQVHAQPSLTAKRVDTLTCGSKVTTLGKQQAGNQSWLHIKADGGVEGWIVDSPDYEIDRSMTSYSLGGTFTMLYPTTWSVQSGNPAIFTAPAGDPTGGTLHLQSAPDASTLPNVPMTTGTEDTQKESTTDVAGISSQVFVYLTNGGGTEYFIERKLGTLVYLIDLQQAQATPDTTFFLQLLMSVNAQFSSPSASPSPSPTPS